MCWDLRVETYNTAQAPSSCLLSGFRTKGSRSVAAPTCPPQPPQPDCHLPPASDPRRHRLYFRVLEAPCSPADTAVLISNARGVLYLHQGNTLREDEVYIYDMGNVQKYP